MASDKHRIKPIYRSPLTIYHLKIMFKTLYVIFGIAVILLYVASAWFGWEFANSGQHSTFAFPFIHTGFRGGK